MTSSSRLATIKISMSMHIFQKKMNGPITALTVLLMLASSGCSLIVILVIVIFVLIALMMAIVVATVLLIWVTSIRIVVATVGCQRDLSTKSGNSRFVVVAPTSVVLRILRMLPTVGLLGMILVLIIVSLTVLVLIVRVSGLWMMAVTIIVMATMRMARHDGKKFTIDKLARQRQRWERLA